MYKKLVLPNNMIVQVADIFGNYNCYCKDFYFRFGKVSISIKMIVWAINANWGDVFSTE